ncbi:hypothetical protein F4604DRAFT_1929750 [Suillus subluteus]|nr:hypothetical protein F4604DRAFT_1929750 [Suillus subluteus]
MHLATSACAPHFNGNPVQLLAFLTKVDLLCDKAGLSNKAHIKAAMHYADPEEAGTWRYVQESKGDSYEDFANAVFLPYLGYSLHCFKCPIPVEATTPDPIPSVCDAIESSPNLCHLQIQDISLVSSTILAQMPTGPSLDKVASSPVQNDLKVHQPFSPTDLTRSLHSAEQVSQSSNQSLSLEKPCITDDTMFCNLFSICPLDEISSVAPEVHQVHATSHDSETCLEHPPVATFALCLHGNMVCCNPPPLARVLAVLCLKLSRSKIPAVTSASMRTMTAQDDANNNLTLLSWHTQPAFDIRKFRVFATDIVLTFASPLSCISLERTKPRYYPTLMRPDPAHLLMLGSRILALCNFTPGAYFGFTLQNHIFSVTLVTKHVSCSLPWLFLDLMLMRAHFHVSHEHEHVPTLLTYVSETHLEQKLQPNVTNLALSTQQEPCTSLLLLHKP